MTRNTTKPATVAYVFPRSHKFRLPFHEALRENLRASGIEYEYLYCEIDDGGRGDLAAPLWAKRVPGFRIGSGNLFYQFAVLRALKYDLVILQQENALLSNYVILLLRRIAGMRTALFGHGRNFQSRAPRGLAERFKAFWSTKVDWWFSYTALSADALLLLGYPADRITVFNNAIDTTGIKRDLALIDSADLAQLRANLVQGSANVAIYIGSLYSDKRISFLLECAQLVRRDIPDFHLIIVGGGPEEALVRDVASTFDWIHVLGPLFGAEKARYTSLASCILMPGAVGLAVLDSFAYAIPMITTSFPYHGPEIAYLRDHENGIIVQDWRSHADYSGAVVRILKDRILRETLIAGAVQSARLYTVENMASNFAGGVRSALSARLVNVRSVMRRTPQDRCQHSSEGAYTHAPYDHSHD